jgi:tRNA acetyltransferase TAN1
MKAGQRKNSWENIGRVHIGIFQPISVLKKGNKLRCNRQIAECSKLLSDFNLLASTMRGNERQMCYELAFLLKEAGDQDPKVDKAGIRGLVVAKTALNPVEAVEKFRALLAEKSYEFRYSLRIIPVEKVVHTELEEIKTAALELAAKMAETETFRVTVEKRFTGIHSHDIIEAVATNVKNQVNLESPDRVLLIEVLGAYSGVSLLKPSDLLSVQKAKML